MTISNVTAYAGTIPERSQPAEDFETNVGDFLPWMEGLAVDLNTTIGEINSTVTDINNDTTTATNAANTATAQADLAEEWASTTNAIVDTTDYSAKEYAIGTTAESAKRHASGTVTTGSAKSWATSTTTVADGLKGARGYAQDSQTILSDVQSVAASIPVGQIDNGDDFSVDTNAWSNIRTAFETNSLPWKPIVNLDFTRDNYEAYVGLSAGTTRAPLLDLATFSRASSGTGVNAFGKVETVGANQPRIVFESGVAKGILLEDTTTNAATWSETDGSNYPVGILSDWAASTQTIGNIVLDDLVNTAIFKDFASASTSSVASMFFYDDGSKVAAGIKTVMRLSCIGDTTTSGEVSYDYATKSFSISGNPAYITLEIKTIKSGFYRVFVKCASSTVTNITAYRVTLYTDATHRSTLGGLQVELGTAIPSSYIKTEGTSVVRAADDFSYPLPSGFNGDGDWTLYADFYFDGDSSSEKVVWSAFIGTASVSNLIFLRVLSGIVSIASGASPAIRIDLGSPIIGKNKVAFKKMGNSVYAVLNGGSVLSDTEVTNASITGSVFLGYRGYTNLSYLDGEISKLSLFSTALPDVVCQAITGV